MFFMVHRIVQQETVNIYRFVTCKSVEEDNLEHTKTKMVVKVHNSCIFFSMIIDLFFLPIFFSYFRFLITWNEERLN
jgi:hypothetical protein|uniref:Uncharacterized protein n=1 Tax=Zea mays TaxID=4577 RepID=B4FLY3_MAIZE|nr:unknown [Zea mays]